MGRIIRDKLDELIYTYGFSEQEILAELGVGDKSYLIKENKDAVKAIENVAKFISPKRYLDKEDTKKEICDFIDFWF